ncbi:hypothetical protein [Streptomyces sp. H51]|uniref:hypothetical protein n=1 Tax=Streptomyces sp. H51 TaxID=3111770 RepID=UPI002D791013|nr:hypothetical protein [Streptomyces sp. H51]
MRTITVARIGWGAVLAAAPNAVLRHCPRTRPSAAARTVVRVLGIRHALRGLATASGAVPASWSVAPDALHATTMAGLALGSDRWRTAACLDLAVAGALAAGGLRAAAAAAGSERLRPRPRSAR